LDELKQNEVVKFWFEYQKMTSKERESLLEDWNQYFSNIENCKASRRFQKMRLLLKSREIKLLKEFATKAREQVSRNAWELNTPYGYDPVYLNQSREVTRYYALENLLQRESVDIDEENIRGTLY